jgi:hypothetical protein
MHRTDPPQCVRRDLRQPEKAHLATRDQIGHGADRFLDRHRAIKPMLIEKVDDIDAEPGERALADGANVLPDGRRR